MMFSFLNQIIFPSLKYSGSSLFISIGTPIVPTPVTSKSPFFTLPDISLYSLYFSWDINKGSDTFSFFAAATISLALKNLTPEFVQSD